MTSISAAWQRLACRTAARWSLHTTSASTLASAHVTSVTPTLLLLAVARGAG